MGFQVTKKLVSEYVLNFMENRSKLFSDIKRDMSAIEKKVIDVIYKEISVDYFEDESDAKRKVDEIMICCLETADKLGFVKIIYDFVIHCVNNSSLQKYI